MKRPHADPAATPTARPLPRMMIGFIVRRCTKDLGHHPTPAEFANWANAQDDKDTLRLFGRAISEREAEVILKHRARLVSAKSARADEEYVPADDLSVAHGGNVVTLADARAKLPAKRRAK
jgi:hypothetical protein